MVKSFQPLRMDWDNANAIYVTDNPSTDWIQEGSNTHYLETYFDTSGYTSRDLTVMPANIQVQEAGRYQMTNPGTQRLLVIDIVSTQKLNVAEVSSNLRNNNEMPGFPNTDVDFTQILYGRFREFLSVTQAATVQDVLAPTSDQQFGSLEPTTAAKLWIYKIVINIGLPDQVFATIKFPSSRVLLNANIVQEDDIPFLMRQKRSYELATQ